MSGAEEKWEWVDEDPIDKLFPPSKAPIENLFVPEKPPIEKLSVPEEVPTEKPSVPEKTPIEKLFVPEKAPPIAPEPPKQSLAEPLIEVAYAHFEASRFNEAINSYSEAIAAEPNHSSAHFSLAVCLEKTKQWKEAATSFRRAFEVDPSRYEALLGLGSCLLHL